MHKVKFLFNTNQDNKTIDIYHKIQIVHKDNALFGINAGGGFALYLGESYISIDADVDSKRIENFGGEIVLEHIKNASIKTPKKSVKGILYIDTNETLQKAMGWRIQFSKKRLYDKNNKILQIGKYNPNKVSYHFFKNAYAQLSKDGTLKGLIITDID